MSADVSQCNSWHIGKVSDRTVDDGLNAEARLKKGRKSLSCRHSLFGVAAVHGSVWPRSAVGMQEDLVYNRCIVRDLLQHGAQDIVGKNVVL